MNDHKVRIVGISDASAPFLSNPVIHTRYSEAVNCGARATQLSSLLVHRSPALSGRGLPANRDTNRLTCAPEQMSSVGLHSLLLEETGIPVNFGYHHDRANRWDRGRRPTFICYAGKT